MSTSRRLDKEDVEPLAVIDLKMSCVHVPLLMGFSFLWHHLVMVLFLNDHGVI